MQAKATVVKIINDELAEIEVTRESACGHSCHTCDGCKKPTDKANMIARNTTNAKIGDIVNVEGETSVILSRAMLVYVLPLVMFFVGYFGSESFAKTETTQIILGILGFALSIVLAFFYNKKIQTKITIEIV